MARGFWWGVATVWCATAAPAATLSTSTASTTELPAVPPRAVGQEAIVQYLEELSKGTPVLLELQSGAILEGSFVFYDEENEKVWIRQKRGDHEQQRPVRLRSVAAVRQGGPGARRGRP